MRFTVISLILCVAPLAAGAFDFDGGASMRRADIPTVAVPPAPAPQFSAEAELESPFPETSAPGIYPQRLGPGRQKAAEPDPREWLEEFGFIASKLETVYSHLADKQKNHGFAYDALKAGYLDNVRAAASYSEYRFLVKAFLDKFSDPHLGAFFFDYLSSQQGHQLPAVTNTVTEDGILVTRISRLYGDDAGIKAGLAESLELAKTARALVVDLRGNGGGNDAYTTEYLSRLTPRSIPGGMVSIRISSEAAAKFGELLEDPARPGFSPWYSSQIRPAGNSPYAGPVAVLIDGGCVSSCEGTAMRFKFSGMARLYGTQTMGSSGNPASIRLPYSNGSLRVPTWIQLMPDETPIEDHGIDPHVQVDPPSGALDAALRDLRSRLAR